MESNSARISWVSTSEIVILCLYLEQLSKCLSSLPDKHWEFAPVCVYCMQPQQLKTFGFGEVEITHLDSTRSNYKIMNMFFSTQPSGYTVGSS